MPNSTHTHTYAYIYVDADWVLRMSKLHTRYRHYFVWSAVVLRPLPTFGCYHLFQLSMCHKGSTPMPSYNSHISRFIYPLTVIGHDKDHIEVIAECNGARWLIQLLPNGAHTCPNLRHNEMKYIRAHLTLLSPLDRVVVSMTVEQTRQIVTRVLDLLLI